MRLIILLFLITCGLLFYGIYLSVFQLSIVQSEIALENPPGYYDYKGITHVHSKASTGSGTYSEILKAGKSTKLDFILFTDANLPKRPSFIEGFYQGMLVLAAGEYTYFDSRILYYGGAEDTPPPGQTQTQVFFADKLSQIENPYLDMIVLAHPYYSSYKWQGEHPPGLRGLEVINLKSVLQKSWSENKPTTVFSVLIFPFNPTIGFLKLFEHPTDEILLWDLLNKKGKIVGFAGNDTNAKIALPGDNYIKFPSYESSFSLVSNHLLLQSELTGDFKKDKTKVLSALKEGQFYMSLDLMGSPKGFLAEIEDRNGKNYPIGSKIYLRKDLKLKVVLPQHIRTNFQIRIIKDGEVYASSNSRESEFEIITPGVYRAEVRVNPRLPLPRGHKLIPWIYTNPFYVIE